MISRRRALKSTEQTLDLKSKINFFFFKEKRCTCCPHTLFSRFLSRTVLTVEESQSCHKSSTSEESGFKMTLRNINLT